MQSSESQSATGEEWEVCRNRKQPIKEIIRGAKTGSAVLNGVELSKAQGKLPPHSLAADRRQEGPADRLRKPVWASGRARRAVGGAGNSL